MYEVFFYIGCPTRARIQLLSCTLHYLQLSLIVFTYIGRGNILELCFFFLSRQLTPFHIGKAALNVNAAPSIEPNPFFCRQIHI